MEQLKVGIADYKITEAPNSLVTYGLGSCVGIALYDKRTEKIALIHIMLADSSSFSDTTKWVKFADLAIPRVVNEMTNGETHSLVAKIAGGASMFSFKSSSPGLQIGQKNVEKVKEVLNELSIPILGEDVGGKTGRTMTVNPEKFEVEIRLVSRETYQI